MKKIVYLSMIVALFAAACSSNKNGFITKRKYTKGYFVDLKSRNKQEVKSHETATAAKKTEVRHAAAMVTENHATSAIESPVMTADAKDAAVVVNRSSKVRTVSNAVNEQHTALLRQAEVKPSLAEKIAAKQAVKKIKKAQKGGDLDDNTILLIILSLFPILALIAMYLHDGKKVTLNFWVDLILHFTVIGYLIFALLVVLDVVDLA